VYLPRQQLGGTYSGIFDNWRKDYRNVTLV
jgi:hypothetical protein